MQITSSASSSACDQRMVFRFFSRSQKHSYQRASPTSGHPSDMSLSTNKKIIGTKVIAMKESQRKKKKKHQIWYMWGTR